MEREDLEAFLAEGLSLDAIGRRVGLHPSTVSYWLAKHGLQANGSSKYGSRPPLDAGELGALVAGGSSVADIAARLGATEDRVRREMKRAGLTTRRGSNRALAAEAFARNERVVALTCQRHGNTDHVLEGRGSYRCKRCRIEQVSDRRRAVKRILVADMGGRCAICGYDRCEAALEFHHVDPTQKSFALSLQGVTRSLAAARAEARKCVLLCATCHAEVEAGVTPLAANLQPPTS
jgi:hypothetical protein